jgi:hypothetical protein
MVTDDLTAFAVELRRQAGELPLTSRRVGFDADRLFELTNQVEPIDKVQAGRIRRTAARFKGFAIKVPFATPGPADLTDAAGELDAVAGALKARSQGRAGGSVA